MANNILDATLSLSATRRQSGGAGAAAASAAGTIYIHINDRRTISQLFEDQLSFPFLLSLRALFHTGEGKPWVRMRENALLFLCSFLCIAAILFRSAELGHPREGRGSDRAGGEKGGEREGEEGK
jgi:hypothetical protein